MKDVGPVERFRHFPGQPIEGRCNLFLVGRNRRRTKDELEDFAARLLDLLRILGVEKGLRKMCVAKINPVELPLELRQLPHHRPFPGPSRLPAMVSGHPLGVETEAPGLGMRMEPTFHFGMLGSYVRPRVFG
jgi:hypothetical protein